MTRASFLAISARAFGIAGILVMSACAPSRLALPERQHATNGAPVRIGLKEGVATAKIECAEPMRVTIGAATLRGRAFTVTTGSGLVLVNGPGGEARGRKLLAESAVPIRVDGVGYRGTIEAFPGARGVTVVNAIGIEDYLRGVVPKEIGYLSERDIEAYKAQALAARTYAVTHLGRRTARGFDLYADVRDQVYGGVAAESEVASRAIDETRGKVIVWQGAPIEAYYHSTCGGSTANVEDVWVTEPIAYLRRVHDADEKGFHCEASRHFRWIEVYNREQIHSIIADHLGEGVTDPPAQLGHVREIAVESQALSGRAMAVRIVTDNGTWTIPRQKIRNVLRRPMEGTPILRSSYIRLFCESDRENHMTRLTVSGGGNGHGIGMCQWGAIGMARKGYSVDRIIAHYYQGVEIVDFRESQLATNRASR